MKTVFTNVSEIAHLFANQTQETARNTGNFYFNGDTIYSYGSHFPIAKHVVNEANLKGLLFTKCSYSNTTSKHIAVTKQATNHLNKIICYSVNGSKADNFSKWLRDIEEQADKLVKAKKPEIYLNAIDILINEATNYAKYFNVELPIELQNAKDITNKQTSIEYREVKTKALAVKALKEAKEAAKKHKIELTKWLSFKTDRLYNRLDVDYLRFNVDKKRIETTQAVQIPEQIAKEFFNTIILTIKNGGCKDCKVSLLDYQVKEINKNFIQVGCHKVEVKEINRIAKQLNWN